MSHIRSLLICLAITAYLVGMSILFIISLPNFCTTPSTGINGLVQVFCDKE